MNPATNGQPALRGKTVLVVEDETSVRNLLLRLLNAHGLNVLTAENGRAALQIWTTHQSTIDLLFTDVVMPGGMSGRDLAERCRAERADLKIIFSSGYNMELSGDDGRLRAGINFLQKPYRPDELLAIIRAALNPVVHPPSHVHA